MRELNGRLFVSLYLSPPFNVLLPLRGRSQYMYNRDHRTFSFPYYRAGEMSPNADILDTLARARCERKAEGGISPSPSSAATVSPSVSQSILHTAVRANQARVARGGEGVRRPEGGPALWPPRRRRQSPGRGRAEPPQTSSSGTLARSLIWKGIQVGKNHLLL